jgi:peptide/nickel transport system substrate-binding protein
MTEPYASPVPRARDTGANYGIHPVASGPYKFASYRPANSLSLVRNEQWDRSSDPARAALPDRIDIRFAVSNVERDRLIASNAVDLDITGMGLSAADQVSTSHDPVLQQRLHFVDHASTALLSLSTAVKPLDNVHCRQAVAWAVDRRQLQQLGELGTGPLATQLLPPSLRDGSPAGDIGLSSTPDGDLKRARQELAACGLPDGFHVNLAHFDNYSGTVHDLVTTLAAVGIVVSPKLTNAFQDPALVRSQQLGLALSQWGGDWPSPYAFFAPLVDAELITPENNANVAEVRDQVIQDDLAAGTSATTDTASALAWSELDEDVVSNAYYVPLLYLQDTSLTSTRLTNVYTTEFFGELDLTAVGVVP